MLAIIWAFSEVQFLCWWRVLPQCQCYWLRVVKAKGWGEKMKFAAMKFDCLFHSQEFSVAGKAVWWCFTHSGTSLVIVVSLLTLCWFYQLSLCSILKMLLPVQQYSPGDFISRNHFLHSSVRSNSSSPQVLSWDYSSVTSSVSTSNSSFLVISATFIVTSSTEILSTLKLSVRLDFQR